MNPVFSAIYSENYELLKELLSDNNNANVSDNRGWTTLHAAVCVNSPDIVDLLLCQPKILVNSQCCEGRTCLLYACETEEINTKIIKSVLEAGADVNIANNVNMTPLHMACRNGNVVVAEMLLKYGANINTKDYNGYTPLHYIALSDCVEILNVIFDDKIKIERSFNRVENFTDNYVDNFSDDINDGYDKKCAINVDNIIDINATDNDGSTPLMLAVDVSNPNVALELINRGADVNIVGKGSTALHFSVVTQQNEIFDKLWEKTDFNIIIALAEINNLLKLMIKFGWFFPDRIKCLFKVLDEPDVNLLMTDSAKILSTFFYRLKFVKNLHEIKVCDIARKLLQRGVIVTQNDLQVFVHNFYKYQYKYELLDVLIQEGLANFDNTDLLLWAVEFYPSFVPTLLSLCINVNPSDIFQHFARIFSINKSILKLILVTLRLHTPNAILKKKCKSHVMTFCVLETVSDNDENSEFIDSYNYVISVLNQKTVPSLKELSRDEFRKYIRHYCIHTYEYLHVLNNLYLPRDIIDLLQCKMAVDLV